MTRIVNEQSGDSLSGYFLDGDIGESVRDFYPDGFPGRLQVDMSQWDVREGVDEPTGNGAVVIIDDTMLVRNNNSLIVDEDGNEIGRGVWHYVSDSFPDIDTVSSAFEFGFADVLFKGVDDDD